MYVQRKGTLGYMLIFALFAFGIFAIVTLSNTNFLRNGVAAQGVVTGVVSVSCRKSETKTGFTVKFTDRTGQIHTGIIDNCAYADFDASPGDSVDIVYLPDNPAQIAPPDGLLKNVKGDLFFTVLTGLITLILLFYWIGRRIRRPKEPELPKRPEQDYVSPSEYTGHSLFHD
jgi:hypothetical protein